MKMGGSWRTTPSAGSASSMATRADGWEGVECDASNQTIIALHLQGKGLTGRMNADIVPFLDILASVQKLELAENDLNADGWPADFTRFVDERCSEPGACTGLPPYSCTAFGVMARPKMDDPTKCDDCKGDKTPVYVLIICTVLLVLLGLTCYVIIIIRYPNALRRWVSFAIILVNHTQTLSILGTLDLSWPPTVRKILSALTLFQIESASCILPPDVASFWLYAYVVLGLSFTVLFSLTLARMLFDLLGKTRWADRAEFVLSVFYATLIVYSLQVCSAILRAYPSSIKTIAQSLAIPLLALLALLCLRFWNKVEAYKRALAGNGWRSGNWISSKGGRTLPRSLRLRVFYLTHRFALHAQSWQFVVWLRQLALVILIFVNELIKARSPSSVKYVRYPAAAIATIVILIALKAHHSVKPYAYKGQNALETFLMVSNVILLSFACGYQYAVDMKRGTFDPGRVERVSREQGQTVTQEYLNALDLQETTYDEFDTPQFTAIEITMILTFIFSLLLTIYNVYDDVMKERKKLEAVDPSLVLTAADMYIEQPIQAALDNGSVKLVKCEWLINSTLTSIPAPTDNERSSSLPEEAYFKKYRGGRPPQTRRSLRPCALLPARDAPLARPRRPHPQHDQKIPQAREGGELRAGLGRPLARQAVCSERRQPAEVTQLAVRADWPLLRVGDWDVRHLPQGYPATPPVQFLWDGRDLRLCEARARVWAPCEAPSQVWKCRLGYGPRQRRARALRRARGRREDCQGGLRSEVERGDCLPRCSLRRARQLYRREWHRARDGVAPRPRRAPLPAAGALLACADDAAEARADQPGYHTLPGHRAEAVKGARDHKSGAQKGQVHERGRGARRQDGLRSGRVHHRALDGPGDAASAARPLHD